MGPVCYIAGAMPAPEMALFRRRESDLLIAADAGYRHLCRQGIVPDLVVGDFDSLGAEPDHPRVIRHPVEKDDTDTLLAVRIGLERGYRRFCIYGGLGGLLDHTLANLQTLLFLLDHGAWGLLLGEGQAVAAVRNGTLRFEGEDRDRVSVFAAGDRAEGVTLRGLYYPLDHGVLTNSFPLGVSNAFTGGPAEISVEQGTLFIIWQGARWPTVLSDL